MLERTLHATVYDSTVRATMRNEREREKRKRTSMGTRSAGAGEVRPRAQLGPGREGLSSLAPSPSLSESLGEARSEAASHLCGAGG